ncbi:hypothetical protein M0R72_17180 [Candidatus Pacearchaeota archaeon]|jgi:hypothetical protein|nr:hypothetical protein [Candidatus Pacearchaeota archaeon]
MLRCCICGSDLGEHDGYVRGSISGEVIELPEGSSPRATGQKNSWEGLAFCLKHFEDIPKNIAENIALIRKKRELEKHDNRL